MVKITDFLDEIARDMPDAINSSMVHLENEVFKNGTIELLSDDDFVRWGSDNPELRREVLLKLLREFRLEGLVRKDSLMWEAFEGQPSMIWRVTRLNDDKEGSLIFFKSFGVTDADRFISKEGETKFVGSYGEVKYELKDVKSCDLEYEILNTAYDSMSEMQLRVMVLLLYSDLMMSVCKNIHIKTIYNMAFEYIAKAFTLSTKEANFNTVELVL